MRISSTLILAVMVFFIFSPATPHVFISSTGQANYFIALDVCDAPGSLVPSNADIPSLYERPCSPELFETVQYIESDDLSFSPSLYFVQLERPPRS